MAAAEPLYAALTVDVDPDANRPAAGRPDAVSPEGEAAFTACLQGLDALVALLEERRLPATFFWEGRTLQALAERSPTLLERVRSCDAFEHGCHGFAHEDFSGAGSGVPLTRPQTRRALRRAAEAFRLHFGRDPQAFRAPYCRMTEHLES
ncbi:MAG: polysaccharide deacetylase family protein, partial [Candidatus Brocadiaceae bacterium]